MYPHVISAYQNNKNPRRPYFDNIFGFMDGFKMEDTKVVIIGLDPAPNRESSGYAYHGSKCNSTENIIEFLNIEFQLADGYNNAQFQFEPSEMKSLKDHCYMGGWVKQGRTI